MAASTIPSLSVWPRPCGTSFGNTQEGPDRLRFAPISAPLSRGFGIQTDLLTPGTTGETGSPIPIFILLWARQKLLLISSQPTPMTEPNNPKHAQQQDLSTSSQRPRHHLLLPSQGRGGKDKQTTLFPDAIPPYNSIHRMPARCVRAYFLIRRRTCASHTLKLDAQWGERTSVDIRNSAHARC